MRLYGKGVSGGPAVTGVIGGAGGLKCRRLPFAHHYNPSLESGIEMGLKMSMCYLDAKTQYMISITTEMSLKIPAHNICRKTHERDRFEED